jgi:GNAT superfamily N-acetyltransferase
VVKDNILIRDFRSDDAIPPITALLHSAYASLAHMGFRYLATHQDDAMTLRRLQCGQGYVAMLEGVIVATVTLKPPAMGSDCAFYGQPGVFSFGQFAVRPDLQRRGIGLRLLQHIEQHARIQGATELALDTAEGATHLCQWYDRLGFRFIQHVSWHDTNYRSVVLSKPLTALPRSAPTSASSPHRPAPSS